jgi:hypothetical protein
VTFTVTFTVSFTKKLIILDCAALDVTSQKCREHTSSDTQATMLQMEHKEAGSDGAAVSAAVTV